ncbi:MAG: hypothetical protein ACKV0T_08460 [Planctomycetales bacterium]
MMLSSVFLVGQSGQYALLTKAVVAVWQSSVVAGDTPETGFVNKVHRQAGRGLATAIRKRERTFPFIVVFPQSQDRT